MYNLNDKIGLKFKVGSVSTFSFTATSGVQLLPTKVGRRDYVRVTNSGSAVVKLFSSPTLSGTEGLVLAANGGVFEDTVSSPLYIQSTGANSTVIVYERKDPRKSYNRS